MTSANEQVKIQLRRWHCQLREWVSSSPRTGLSHSSRQPWQYTTSLSTTLRRCPRTGKSYSRNTTLSSLVSLDFVSRITNDLTPHWEGGGSAGAVVANRLSENPRWRVLLLEAGGQETTISDLPMVAPYLQLGSMDWRYRAEPQPGRACLGKIALP